MNRLRSQVFRGCSARLVERANEAGGKDDVTAVVARFEADFLNSANGQGEAVRYELPEE